MALTLLSLLFVLLANLASGVPLSDRSSVDIAPHVVGGTDAPEGFAPHMMGLVFGEWVRSFMCGASIISSKHVLTAAHCNDALVTWGGSLMPSVRGVYGSNRWDSTEKNAIFTHYINHEGWDSFVIKNDIGILYMKKQITMNARVSPIALEFHYVGEGERTYVTGWGRLFAWGPIPDKLQMIPLNTIGEQTCRDGVREAAGGLWAPPINWTIEICASHEKGVGFGICNGDSGSALVSKKTKKQIGIASWGFPCARGAPDMYVRVSGFSEWIKNILYA